MARLSSLARLTPTGGVHGSLRNEPRQWRAMPLLQVAGEKKYFKTGVEAVQLLVNEARRRDEHKAHYLAQFEAFMQSLTPVFDRAPRYAWLAKIFLEPERALQFRVSYLDDSGNVRTHRGYRVQYSSTLGPYSGALHFGPQVNSDMIKGMAFASNFGNALTGARLGGAAGGSNFDPSLASEPEIQRFCQSFMTELQKYIGPDRDLPLTGCGVGRAEVGYLYGQYKRSSGTYERQGTGLLWGGTLPHPEAYGYGAVSFAKHMLADRGESLEGKRCLITGSGQIALAVAEHLIAHGAVPVSFSDRSGHVYEEEGINEPKLRQIQQIKSERGARIGRYIIASTTAKFSEPANIFDIPCDLVFPCSVSDEIDGAAARTLANNGCIGVIDAAHAPSTPDAVKTYKKLGLMYAPAKATLSAATKLTSCGGDTLKHDDIAAAVDDETARIYDEVKRTANEYNVRGDLKTGADIASFLRVANVMATHGAI